MAVIGNRPNPNDISVFKTVNKQSITGTGDSSYNLSYDVSVPEELEVFVNNVRQEPRIAYDIASGQITFAEGIDSTDDCYIIFQGSRVGTVVPGENTITNGMLKDNSVTASKLVDSSITSSKLSDTYADIVGSVGKVKLQRVSATLSTNTVFNVTTDTAIVSVNITVAQGSDVFVTFNGEQNGNVGDSWQWVQLFRGTTALGTSTITVTTASHNDHISLQYWDENLAAGTYTYSCKVRNGANYMNWGEHSTPIIECIEFG